MRRHPITLKKAKKRGRQWQKFTGYIGRILNWLRIQFYAGEYKLTIRYYERIGKKNSGVAAQVLVDRVYLTIDMDIADICWQRYLAGDTESLANILVHEMCHVFTCPLMCFMPEAKEAREAMERQTERICNAMLLRIPKSLFTIR